MTRNRKLMIGAAVVLVLLIAAVVAYQAMQPAELPPGAPPGPTLRPDDGPTAPRARPDARDGDAAGMRSTNNNATKA